MHIGSQFDTNVKEHVGPNIKNNEENIIEHTTLMVCQPPNSQKKMELIHAWVNNPNTYLMTLIDWPIIGESPINEYVTLGFLDMTFPRLFLNDICD